MTDTIRYSAGRSRSKVFAAGWILLASIVRNRRLMIEMAKRDLLMTTKGAILGWSWLAMVPLVQALAYVLFVSLLLRGNVEGGRFDYVIYVLSGQIPWAIVTRALQDAPVLLRNRSELVKQVIYPVESLPVTSVMVGTLGTALTFLVFMIFAVPSGAISISIMFLPIALAVLGLFLLGVSWIFMIAGVIFKDLKEIATVLLGLLALLSPVVMTEELVGPRIWQLLLWNPLAHIVVVFRDVFFGEFHVASWCIVVLITVIAFITGGWLLSRAKIAINEYL
jgi:lipopolysaccharide transport system permease protein